MGFLVDFVVDDDRDLAELQDLAPGTPLYVNGRRNVQTWNPVPPGLPKGQTTSWRSTPLTDIRLVPGDLVVWTGKDIVHLNSGGRFMPGYTTCVEWISDIEMWGLP